MTTERVRIDLSGAPQTMLATLYAKALDADFEHPILGLARAVSPTIPTT